MPLKFLLLPAHKRLELKLTTQTKIFLTVIYSGASTALVFVLWNILHSDVDFVIKYIAFLAFSSATCICIFQIADSFYKRLILKQDLLIVKSIRGSDIIYFNDIAGIKRSESGEVVVIHKLPARDSITIPIGFKKQTEIIAWLSTNFQNLAEQTEGSAQESQNRKKQAEELMQAEILSNPALGPTEEIRQKRFDNIRKFPKYFSWASTAIALWVMIYPTPYQLSTLVAFAFPLVAAAVAFSSNGVIKLIADPDKGTPSLAAALPLPGLALALRGFNDFDVVEYFEPVWLILVALTIGMSILFLRLTKELKQSSNWPSVVYLSLMLFGYNYGTYMMANCEFDTTITQQHQVTVVDKHAVKKKNTSYYFTLNAWGPKTLQDDVEVSAELFNKTAPGDTVVVNFSHGQLMTSWFYITE